MTVDNSQSRELRVSEKPPLTVQNDVQQKNVNKEVREDAQKEATGIANAQTGDKLTLAANNSEQPKKQINETAQTQISKGYVDVRI